MKEKDKSLLEIAIELLNGKQKPQKLNAIIREVMELKGVKTYSSIYLRFYAIRLLYLLW